MMFRSCFVFVVLASFSFQLVANGQETESQTKNNSQPAVELKPSVAIAPQVDPATLRQKSSFIIGYNMGKEFGQQGLDVDFENLTLGIKTALEGKEMGMTEEEVRSVVMAYSKIVQERQIAKMTKISQENDAAGKAFMTDNAKNENVKTMENGVQYEILKKGEGDLPAAEDVVRIHYHGTFPDGEVFDSSIEPSHGGPGKPVEFSVGRVVPGFSSALQAMTVGSKWKVVIPGELAYGIRGHGDIGPNQTLVFEIELLDIVK